MAVSPLADFKVQLIRHAVDVNALQFGSFTLKSGRYASLSRSRKMSKVFISLATGFHRISSMLVYCAPDPFFLHLPAHMLPRS